MSSPNMSTLTSSLERSLQNCSLNSQHSSSSSSNSINGGARAARGSVSPPPAASTRTLELNSQTPLPYHWEQCLDMQSGEIYYINWRTGMKATEDPRTTPPYSGEYYSEDDTTSYESDGSSSPSSSSRHNYYYNYDGVQKNNGAESNITFNFNSNSNSNSNNVLVVAGCKSCLMYYMVPKQLEICPKCCGQLLHFDRSENGSP